MSRVHPSELSIFAEPWLTEGVTKVQYVDYRPIAQLSDDTVIDFHIPGTGSQYLDLKNTRLHMRLQITKENGEPIDATNNVGFVATPLHSMFSQVDILLQQENITGSNGLYQYQAYVQKLLETSTGRGHPQAQSELYIIDGSDNLEVGNHMDNPDITDTAHRNEGLYLRSKFTNFGRVLDLEGSLHCDICKQDRYLLNSVDVRYRLFPSSNAFRLITKDEEKYKVKILDAYLRVCKITVSPEVILAHNETLKTKPAIYPYYKTDLKSYTIPKGQYSVNIDEPFQSNIPTKLYVFFVNSSAFNGDYGTNPFNFHHYDLRSAAFYVDGVSVPNQPLHTSFSHREITSAYNALLETAGKIDPEANFDIDIKRFLDGFTIFAFNLEAMASSSIEYWVQPKSAHSRLELKFGSALPENINVVLMAISPQLLHIDNVRNVSLRAS